MRETIRWDLEPSALHFQFSAWTFEANRRGLVVRVIGEYRHGSAGRDDAVIMNSRISEACELATAEAVVVDLRSLDYQWGDDIDIDPRGRLLRALAVVRTEQVEAFAPMLGRERLRTDLELALADAESAVSSSGSTTRTLTRLSLEISDLERLCRVWTDESNARYAWLAFYGECRSASDSMWIQWQIDVATALVEPRGLLIDVRELEVITHPVPTTPRRRKSRVQVVAGSEDLENAVEKLEARE